MLRLEPEVLNIDVANEVGDKVLLAAFALLMPRLATGDGGGGGAAAAGGAGGGGGGGGNLGLLIFRNS